MKKAFRILSLLATGLAVVGCQDFENGFSAQEIKNAEYAAHFEKVFGTPDPNQDWSMATLVKANVNLPDLTGTAKMNICTGDPRHSETRLLAQIMLKDGKGSIDFDAIKGSDNVFVTVEQDGEYKVFSQYALQNGMLNIGDFVLTRSGKGSVEEVDAFSTSCPTTLGTETRDKISVTDVSYTSYVMEIHDSYRYFTRQEWIEKVLSGEIFVSGDQNGSPFTDASIKKYGTVTGIDWAKSFTLKDDITYNTEELISWNGQAKTLEVWKNEVNSSTANTKNNYFYGGGNYPFEPSSIGAVAGDNSALDWTNPSLRDGADKCAPGELYTYNGLSRSLAGWKADAEANTSYILANSYNGIWTNASLKAAFNIEESSKDTPGATFVGLTDPSTWVVRNDGGWAEDPRIDHPQLQYLKNVEQAPAPEWTAGLGYSFFGDGAFFQESVAYYSQGNGEADHCTEPKLGKYYTKEEMVEMEKGFTITTKGGPITLPYIFGCTAFTNQFGYIYWKDGDEKKPGFDPLALPHFVLIEDARPSQNISRVSYDTNGDKVLTPVVNSSNGSLADWADYKGALAGLDGTQERQDAYQAQANKSVQGTSYRVMFFGDDYKNTTGNYEWESGYHIVFFIATLANSDRPDLIDSRDTYSVGHFHYSLPEYNLRVGSKYQNPFNLPERADDGMVKCIVWSRDGYTYMGFGDNSGDQDLNDIVFLVAGNFDTDVPPVKVAPIKWHLNYDGIHHDADSDDPVYKKDDDLHANWSLNVGAKYNKPTTDPVRAGYVFKGWAAAPNGPVLTNDKLTNVTVETENGACYFAIWEPEGGATPEAVTVKWHKNYDGKHHDGTNDTTLDDDLHKTDSNVEKGSHPTKPDTNPTPQTGKQFLGWAESPDATTALTDDQLADITINVDKCFYAVYGDAPTPPGSDPEPITWIFACEDLGGTFDYDFNDVVWEVRHDVVSGKVQARLLAAGGTLPFTLQYDGTKICTKAEVYGESNVSTVYETQGSTWFDVLTESSWTISDNSDKFKVVVEDSRTSTVITGPTTGAPNNKEGSKTPEVILVPGDWCWPKEGICIKEAYKNFTNWVFSSGMTGWADSKQDGKTVSRSATHN